MNTKIVYKDTGRKLRKVSGPPNVGEFAIGPDGGLRFNPYDYERGVEEVPIKRRLTPRIKEIVFEALNNSVANGYTINENDQTEAIEMADRVADLEGVDLEVIATAIAVWKFNKLAETTS